ncbi:molybdopterin-dependent oxidoreductase [Virgifigura deserti]|uniref:molybdopterin-dependent oxidoreductase n=1 Tax=Virgifigura deserti TaxID=2268457 RepID=UPI003CCC3F12
MAFSALAAAAEFLPAPKGDVVLTVSGNIEHANAPGAARFDLAMLEALPSHRIITQTPWTDSAVEFIGPLARDVMRLVGAEGAVVQAVALNDYKAPIPMADFHDYDVIIALKLNGQHMRIRDKGPLWIAYPLDEHPEIASSAPPKMVWQLKALVVQ